MDWSAALHVITQVPADIFGLQAGRIEVGEPATLVLWNGDPLEVTTWAEAVMVDGEWIDAASRQTRLFERYQDLGVGKARGFLSIGSKAWALEYSPCSCCLVALKQN